MILPYGARLTCLCLAAFFLVHLAVALMVSFVTPPVIRFAKRMPPAAGARVLLVLRLLPAGFAAFAVVALCVPSYLWLEPNDAVEPTGLACLAAALIGTEMLVESLTRAGRALARSERHLRECQERSREIRLPGERTPAWVVDGPPCVMLAGVIRPRLVISRAVVAALSAEQLAVVVRHERAHGLSRDNFKRLLILLAPGILPFRDGFRDLDRAWAKLTEWAADDRASAGKTRRSLSLAAALVQVARLGSIPVAPALATSLMADGDDLSERVDRLLHPARRTMRHTDREPLLAASVALMLVVALGAVIAHPLTMHSAHELLELLIQ